MLVLLLVVHLLFKNSSLAEGHSLDSRVQIDSCDDINHCRRRFDIIWGCLTTIFASTWVSVHPNVPPPDQSWLALLWRRLRMMLVAIIAPEVMVAFAARQFFAARLLSKELDVSVTHGFFLCMGGFVSRVGLHPIATKKQLEDPEVVSAIRNVKVVAIMDKSKADALSKGVAIAQGLWFTTQCLARVHQHLPVTQLEVATLAFAVVNIAIRLFWWGKPLDVQQAIPIGSARSVDAETTCTPFDLSQRFLGLIFGEYSGYNPISSPSVPSFWSMEGRGDDFRPFFIELLSGIVFGAIHCAAWNAQFASADEMWMWRACSLLVAALPAVIAFPHTVVLGLHVFSDRAMDDALPLVFRIVAWILVPIYIIARLFLIILAFTALRALLPGAFIDVDWSVFIPHF